jgi:ABC-type polysaccharide/polyol phosphate export permease
MTSFTDTLYFAWIIGTKDIQDALKNKNLRTNIIIMVGMVIFFYWLGTLRPFDKNVSVVVYDAGNSNLTMESISLGEGVEYTFQVASSLDEMMRKMYNQNLGLVIPVDFNRVRASGDQLTLNGYIYWVNRMKVAELEEKYSRDFSEILDLPVQVIIGQNIIIPRVNGDGMPSNVASQLVYFVFWTALGLIPYLMLEEKQTKTLDALLTSPASPGQVVLGKALAGFFYILIIGGLSIALNWAYIVRWDLALAAFLGYGLFAVGLGLALGSFIKSGQQVKIWSLVLIIFMVVPPLFYTAPNLKANIRTVLTWFPATALASLFRYACSVGSTPVLLLQNLGIAVVSIGIAFGLVIWKVRRSDR